MINADSGKYLTEAASPDANSPSVKDHPVFLKLFASEVPSDVDGFQCPDQDRMAIVWPAGTDTAREVRLIV
jgi:deoxyribodipyrimidine photo-lyase